MLYIDFCGIISCNAFSVAPSMINDNPKNTLFHCVNESMKRSNLQMHVCANFTVASKKSANVIKKKWLKEKWKISDANAFKNLHKFCKFATNVGATTLSITTFSIMALSMKGTHVTLSVTMLCY
jgi:hypothetical protein